MCSFSTRNGVESHSIPRFKRLVSGKSLLTVEVYVENQPLVFLSISHTLPSLRIVLHAYSLWTEVKCEAVKKFLLIHSHVILYNSCLGFPEAQKSLLPVSSRFIYPAADNFTPALQITLLFHWCRSVLRFLFIQSEMMFYSREMSGILTWVSFDSLLREEEQERDITLA